MNLRVLASSALRCTRPLLAYNKSSGYRWSPIPKPPPPHYDRLYGVHSVLNTLRVAAAAAQQQAQSAPAPTPAEVDALPDLRKKELQRVQSMSSTPMKQNNVLSALHPHRAHLSCLYVRDFSAEDDRASLRSASSSAEPQGRRRKVIPARYTAVRCIAALAKSLEVPVRFVPRSELVQLCGERRNQNVVLEASSYVPRSIQRLEEVWGTAACGSREAINEKKRTHLHTCGPHRELILFLEHIIDPTNIGNILRTAFFFGVDHVILSRDCAACTATVSRTSTGFLEHLHVHQATVPTSQFLRAAFQAWKLKEGPSRLEVIASAVVMTESSAAAAAAPTAEMQLPESSSSSSKVDSPLDASASIEITPDSEVACLPEVRLLLLGNEDAGLPEELLRCCTHVAHVRSPRQRRLRQVRRSATERRVAESPSTPDLPRGERMVDAEDCSEASDGGATLRSVPHHPASEMDRREHNLQRLARLREKEVSLNVNTATAALLTALAAVEGQLPTRASLGMVEVQACADVPAASGANARID